jgi:hypothetical protein
LTARRVRQIIAGMLASRETDQPPGFVQLQVARLSKAMTVARTMMMRGNLQAMDRWIKLMSELERYPASHRPKFPGRGMWRRSRASPRRSPARSRRTEAFPSPGSRRERA